MPPSGFHAQAAAGLMRSLLFVPADSERKIPKALAAEADIVILDLEDSVAPADKPRARGLAAEALSARKSGAKLFVRINSLSSGLAPDDVAAILPARPDGVVLPKSDSALDVVRLGELLIDHEEHERTPILAIVTETARSLFHMGTYAEAGERLVGIAWGMEDLATALGAQSNRDDSGEPTEPYRLARALCLIGARAAGVEPIDAVYANFRDIAGLERQCREAVRDGFTAKMCIHPDQVPVINAAFTPAREAVARARRIIDAFAASGGAGVISIDGEMLDVPHLKAARNLLARAAKLNEF
jgi:citrate lyase subunit beta/citryl-CoA lyase